jgi:hypothetical protein
VGAVNGMMWCRICMTCSGCAVLLNLQSVYSCNLLRRDGCAAWSHVMVAGCVLSSGCRSACHVHLLCTMSLHALLLGCCYYFYNAVHVFLLEWC